LAEYPDFERFGKEKFSSKEAGTPIRETLMRILFLKNILPIILCRIFTP